MLQIFYSNIFNVSIILFLPILIKFLKKQYLIS
jgi:hypothetical protein